MAAGVQVWLYDASGNDRELELAKVNIRKLGDDQLLWIDLADAGVALKNQICRLLAVEARALDRLADHERPLFIDKYEAYFALTVSSPPLDAGQSQRLSFIVGQNWLVTLHAGAAPPYLAAFRAQDKGETAIGQLVPTLLLAALLDWHLVAFLDEISALELHVDKLDKAILQGEEADSVLRTIVRIRGQISALRRTLAEQRSVFYGISRTDIVVDLEADTVEAFARLASRFDRTIDEVERTRDVLIGSFDLFTSLAAHATNDLVRVLTFVTVVVGLVGAVAGIFGMNFDLPFFETGTPGFLTVIGSLLILSGIALFIARRRDWV
jgi:magnesium transporter